MFYSLAGKWNVNIGDEQYQAMLPGTLDENEIGNEDAISGSWHPDVNFENAKTKDGTALITTRFRRRHTYQGAAVFTKTICYQPPEKKRIFLEVERARSLRLFIDGAEVPYFMEGTLSTPHIFEVTGLLTGKNEVKLVSDNSYQGLPREAILCSLAATDETQTNWNGILGYFRLRIENPVFIQSVRVYPKRNKLSVFVEFESDRGCETVLTVKSDVQQENYAIRVRLRQGNTRICLNDLVIKKGTKRWDEYAGNLYRLTASACGCEEKTVEFGVREFGGNQEGRLVLNGRTIFLRGETNCAVFPETGHPPMEKENWLEILGKYKKYGVNHVRFHSYCPPESAFEAADQLGILIQPELSNWNPKDAFESEASFVYYKKELQHIILCFANHPSFVMLTLGNELWPAAENGQKRMDMLVKFAKEWDSTRLYANGSNVCYAQKGCHEQSDFYTSQAYYEQKIRGSFAEENGDKKSVQGYINGQYPGSMKNYSNVMEEIRKNYKKSIFSFEVGQYEILPDFDELKMFRGVLEPENIWMIKRKAEEKWEEEEWKERVEATGELARICYREEIESVLRTPQMSGLSLLGLQDFPGQGTALVGMMNSHLQPKPFPFARPEEFRKFFRAQLPLVYLPKYTYESVEMLKAETAIANYGKEAIKGTLQYELKDGNISVTRGKIKEVDCFPGSLKPTGRIEIPLESIRKPAKLILRIFVDHISNEYPVWVYPQVKPQCPEMVMEARKIDEGTEKFLENGGTVYLSPKASAEMLPKSIQTQFSTNFWSVKTFPQLEGGMGQLIDVEHPIFENFPTEKHTNWQWWIMSVQRAVILPKKMQTIITEIDNCENMRYMAKLFECRCGKGKILFSSMGLQDLQQYPEARALQDSTYKYLVSPKFQPKQVCSIEVIKELVL